MHRVSGILKEQGLREASRWRPVMAGLAAAGPGAIAAGLAAGLAAAGPGAIAAILAAAAGFFGCMAGPGAAAGFLAAGLAGMGAGAAAEQPCTHLSVCSCHHLVRCWQPYGNLTDHPLFLCSLRVRT